MGVFVIAANDDKEVYNGEPTVPEERVGEPAKGGKGDTGTETYILFMNL